MAGGNHVQQATSVSSQLLEAAVLMGVGMVSVFIFLALLIVAMMLLKKVVEWFPEPEKPSATPNRAPAPLTTSEQQNVIAAISAAVHQYRSKK